MKFSKYISLLLLTLILVSCSGIKSSWKNFRAHYNSYYNAEKSYSAGLRTVEDQPVEVNPEMPQRVHLSPPGVSEQNFDNTIEKGAEILRKFPESKWTDDALYLLGKSYYYKEDFYLAIEKFEELAELTTNRRYRQEALVWKARSQLDLEEYLEGISFITGALNVGYLTGSYLAELKVLLSEHYAMLGNWKESADYMGEAMAGLRDGKLKGRAFFLYGQVLERLERYGEAFFAYDKVASQFPDYEYIYWSRMKKAEVARKEGNLESAISIYTSMSRDDKNVSRLDRINYEISRTYEMMGDIQQAEQRYKEILHDSKTAPSQNVRAKTYYRLGKIYSDQYQNFTTAAAYYDSASTQNANTQFLEDKFDAGELASAYGSYSELKSEINRVDSLLWLSSLSSSDLDSVVNTLRDKRREALNRRLQNRESATGRLANVGNRPSDNLTGDTSLYGFLNYKNPRLKRESINNFQALWGSRPLVDNWRRIEVVRSTGLADVEREEDRQINRPQILSEDIDSRLNIDLSEIPATSTEKEEYRQRLIGAKYRLGNLFLLTMNMPDSASTYFLDIIRNYPESELVPQSMYSLFEINSENGNDQQFRYWGNRILREYPETRYADKVDVRLNGMAESEQQRENGSENLLAQLQRIENASDTLSIYKAEQFRRLALANSSSDMAPYIHYRSIRSYVQLAKNNTERERYRQFLNVATEPDSVAGDSLVAQLYPFYGTYWDSVRNTISEYDSLFADKPLGEDVQTLRKYLNSELRTEAPPIQFTAKTKTEAEPVETVTQEKKALRTCRDLGTNLEIVGGMTNFLSRIDYPRELCDKVEAGEISYRIVVSEDGKVDSSTPLTTELPPALKKAFDNAINSFLYFDPILINGKPEAVSCSISFPIKKQAQHENRTVAQTQKQPSKQFLRACEDLDSQFDVVGGMKNFLSTVNYPEGVNRRTLSGEITFEIYIEANGKVRVVKMLSSQAPGRIDQAFQNAIDNRLYFDPYTLNDRIKNQSCSISFPVGGGY
ncbi:tetratricopeptide repeat protein [Balneolaceae bacterium YR4-1]|uniref:Tetratricopeptide repeat protein n=1 Tax=Halalkalibaculum roseum TaxID=2709311 RepID=A0A6M1T0I3_9BACT|nr:tetratricopeptide repeat protein [Halalkalibaculum roseum]NGP77004.1 tetratricopeptide repeat protein [Halalkalibaculum roseum]